MRLSAAEGPSIDELDDTVDRLDSRGVIWKELDPEELAAGVISV